MQSTTPISHFQIQQLIITFWSNRIFDYLRNCFFVQSRLCSYYWCRYFKGAFRQKISEDEYYFLNLQVYPDEGHDLTARYSHLYKLYTDFLQQECWGNQAYEFDKQRTDRVVTKTLEIHGLPEEKLQRMRARQYFEEQSEKGD